MRTGADPRVRQLRAWLLALSGAILVVLAVAGSACSAGSKSREVWTPLVIYVFLPVPPSTAASASKANTTTMTTTKAKVGPVQLTLVGCSHGTVGIGVVNAPQPHWVIASLHLRALRGLRGLRLASIELLDKGGAVVTRSLRAESLRIGKPQVGYPDRCLPYARQRPNQLSKAGTRPFDGKIAPRERHRLWLHVRMVPGYWRAARARPTSCRITFTDGAGMTYKATIDQVGGWPTG